MNLHSLKSVGLATVVLATISTTLNPSAYAAEVDHVGENQSSTLGNVTGGDVNFSNDVIPADIQAQADLKQAAADAYFSAKFEGGSDLKAIKATRAYLNAYPVADKGENVIQIADRLQAQLNAPLPEARLGGEGIAEVNADSSAASTGPAAMYMALNHYPQKKSYWCGPATGKMILKWLNAGKSAYDGKIQVQANIANDNHMKTETNGVTSWASGRFRIGLNRWLSGSDKGWYIDTAKPSTTTFRNAVVYGVDTSHPFGADTVEFAGGYHYNNHPANQTIGHWIVVRGYGSYGDTTYFADPATSVWGAVAPMFTANTNNFVNRHLQNNGITW